MKASMAMLAAACCLATGAHAASFDCKKARSEDEKAVCASPELSRLDDDMAAAYKAALGLMSGDNKRVALFRKDQADWVKDRGAAGARRRA